MHTKRVCRKKRCIRHARAFTKPRVYAPKVARLYGAGTEASEKCMDWEGVFTKACKNAVEIHLLILKGRQQVEAISEVAEAT